MDGKYSSSMARMMNNDGQDGSVASGGESLMDSGGSSTTENDYTSNSGSSQNTNQRVKEASEALAGRDTRFIYGSKAVFFLVLLMAAAGSSYAVYRISARNEESAYETRFEDFANEVLGVSQLNAEAVESAFDSMALSITASTKAQAWPNATIAGFEAKAQQLMEATDAVLVELAPVVTVRQQEGYQAFVQEAAPIWIAESLEYWHTPDLQISVPQEIYDQDQPVPAEPVTKSLRPDPYFVPVAQYAPVQQAAIHLNLLSMDRFLRVHDKVIQVEKKVISDIVNPEADPFGPKTSWPHVMMVSPIFDKVTGKQEIVAFMGSEIGFEAFLHDLLPEDIDPLYVVVQNSCNQELTYLVEGPEVTFLGQGDLHESKDSLFKRSDFTAFQTLEDCQYAFYLYPSVDFYDSYHSNAPIINAVAVGATFLLTALLFILYDYLVESRQRKVMKSATKSAAIVSSLFPKNVRDRLMRDDQSSVASGGNAKKKVGSNLSKAALASNPILAATRRGSHMSKPIADLFPNVSVMFADIVGFTAWSSTREPSHVFELLESVYSTFDKVARKLRVFKVETIGDCYVAACGLPEPEENHAVIMTRFAKICMEKMHNTVHRLAALLGPGTSDLTMRVGIHSGPVTAGVLRGEKSRFQLFGDTVNTTARIESTGMPRRIHISQETADLLLAAGKAKWIVPREDAVQAKGKGVLKTYWVVLAGASTNSDSNTKHESSLGLDLAGEGLVSDDIETAIVHRSSNANEALKGHPVAAKMNELEVAWNADVIKNLVRKIVAFRGASKESEFHEPKTPSNRHPLEEVKEVIDLPNKAKECKLDPTDIELSKEVEYQIEDYVRTIASMYRNNAFHNFSHASHVVQSTLKLLSRIVDAEKIDYNEMTYQKQDGNVRHKFSYGITSDPITQFACVFAALIHDVDHCGVPNSQLVKEQSRVAVAYDNKSVAEQNSLDLAWDLLMEDAYSDFRACLYTTEVEFQRFRQLLVNMVMATDIMDKDLKQLRNDRWEKAFAHRQRIASSDNLQAMLSANSNENEDTQEEDNRMATIVIEHLIQASDVAHTMQHWHVYTKWNERLFHEMYTAFKAGRADKDPSLNWYEGELGFFDFYIIPLAKKLQECKIFGVSSDEYLNYAQANRKEWESRGKEAVAKYLEAYQGE